ncbi:uncharacterized protein MAM_00888 [Metarhizium album ARSEF 1941]|uniref:Methyltransferase domain-containing protein n=1 Tax=Metarhizium album (strain ARSEF 1941) TaxID=1081103 RepID=A0A0B2X040_METAS|nr:uncharacterized protein MAM_00888 [Metarhizium album ARSEF 1941]KHO01887.1 hypothetical protein MAM_00888 [Metarhizium album ARSEF 1941]
MAVSISAGEFTLGFIAGSIFTVTLAACLAFALLRPKDIYGLGHWKLNVRTPFRSLWMNLGFWTADDGSRIDHLDVAARALLEKIVQAAGLLVENQSGETTSKTNDSVAVLDVGFGCGDQTVALAELIQASSRPQFRYVGLTLNAEQLQAAQERLNRALSREDGRIGVSTPSQGAFKLFRADAARPESWSSAVHASVDSLADEAFPERWLVALDCLYHFSPSRESIFKLAAKTLDANVMAFDLVLNENASMWHTIAVRFLGFTLSCPFYTFLTAEQYREQLIECGYDEAHIEIRDISDHVFEGLSGHLSKQQVALSRYGISLAGYNLTGKVFKWFDQTRVIKATIVIARTKRKT